MKKIQFAIATATGFLFVQPLLGFGYSRMDAGAIYYYEPETSTLRGILTQETFPGPPEYSSIREGDKLESYWVLKLDRPIEVSAKNRNDEEGLKPTEKQVRALQLTMDFDKITPAKLGFKKGARFEITGTLFHQHTAHHVSRVLIWVQDGTKLK